MKFYELPSTLKEEEDQFERDIQEFVSGNINPIKFKAIRVAHGVYEQRQEHTYMIRIRCAAGGITPTQLKKVAELAKSTNQYFVNYRWLGGMLTNWGTISNSIKKLQKINTDLKSENRGFTKKELLKMSIQRDKLQRSLGGISKMKKIPDLVFIIDTNYESLAIKEAIKLNIPIIAILDTNSNPDGINFPVPGNDDARRSIDLYCNLIKETIIDAKKVAQTTISKESNESPGPDETAPKKTKIKGKTIQEIDRDKLDKKFSNKKEKKVN